MADQKRLRQNRKEKRRRERFTMLINEIDSMINPLQQKRKKSRVLQLAISFLKHHNEKCQKLEGRVYEEQFLSSFVSDHEGLKLFLEAIDGVLFMTKANGRICHVSEEVSSVLGYHQKGIVDTSMYEIVHKNYHSALKSILSRNINIQGTQESFKCYVRRGDLGTVENPVYEYMEFTWCFCELDEPIQVLAADEVSDSDHWTSCSCLGLNCSYMESQNDCRGQRFIAIGRLQLPLLHREIFVMNDATYEFMSKHSMDWKFLFLDLQALSVTGYSAFEILGKSGYEFYHVDDLDKMIQHHETLIKQSEGISCCYRFLTKGEQWIWLQSSSFVMYDRYGTAPEYVISFHRVANYADIAGIECDKDFTSVTSTSSLPSTQGKGGQQELVFLNGGVSNAIIESNTYTHECTYSLP